MGILDRLKKEKKEKSVLDSLVKKKEDEKAAKEVIPEKPSDIEVREMPATDPLQSMDDYTGDDLPEGMAQEAKPSREFRTEGMHEFTLDSLGANADGTTLKLEYKSRVLQAIDKGQIDEAIKLLEELKLKLLVEE
ncbi:hypothetical protein A2Y85_04535 [candidate division WOR-3 bacterium RBG_13_43_14]|uniref:Uncharacterized protein n=1 Tax=candidate division WOR-3 bacterium RBG_13_43_14 TaxID=1802590 RepID=A0A1F4U2L4_UNCW3|nr:MAG: hypothetical protein A2Y85_04535 [candidate division WOR-3 bacterium RBG_13_43_14]